MNPVPDNKPKHQLPPYPGHPHPMHRMPHPESPHGLPPAHGAFVDRDWRHLESPSSYDAHHPPNSLPHSNAPRPLPIPAPGHPYATGPSRDFHLPPPKTQPPDGVYHARPTSLPSLAQPGDYRAGTHSIPPINGAPHDATPQSAPPEYPRMHYSSPDQLTNGEPPPYSAPYLPHPPSAAYDATYYANQSMGVRQRKVARAQQVTHNWPLRRWLWSHTTPAN